MSGAPTPTPTIAFCLAQTLEVEDVTFAVLDVVSALVSAAAEPEEEPVLLAVAEVPEVPEVPKVPDASFAVEIVVPPLTVPAVLVVPAAPVTPEEPKVLELDATTDSAFGCILAFADSDASVAAVDDAELVPCKEPLETAVGVTVDTIVTGSAVDMMVTGSATALLDKFPLGKVKLAPLKQHRSGTESAAGGQQNSPAPQEMTVSNAPGLTKDQR